MFVQRRKLKLEFSYFELLSVNLVQVIEQTFNRHPGRPSKSLSLDIIQTARETWAIDRNQNLIKIAVNFSMVNCCRICLGMILIAAWFLAQSQQLSFPSCSSVLQFKLWFPFNIWHSYFRCSNFITIIWEKVCTFVYTRRDLSSLVQRLGNLIEDISEKNCYESCKVRKSSSQFHQISTQNNTQNSTLSWETFFHRTMSSWLSVVCDVFFSTYFFSRIWIWREMMCVIASVREFVHEKVIKTLSTYDFRSFHNVFISMLSVCSDSRKMVLQSG